jgi:cytochrome c biogenesis protein
MDKQKRSESFLDAVVEFFASVELALVILFAIAVASIGGTIVPQNLPPEQYLQAYGPKWFTFFGYLDLYDMYHAWWFNLLLGLLIVNLIVCSAKRLPQAVRLARRIDPDRISPAFLEKQPFSVDLTDRLPAQDLGQRIETALGRGFGRVSKADQPWGRLWYADRFRFARFGAYVVHASLLFIAVGGILGTLFGFSAFVNISEGRSTDQVIGRRPPGRIALPFTVRLDDFDVSFYQSGQPKEYRSEVTILEDGRPVDRADILVNHPYTRYGVTIYQSSYGQASVGQAVLRVSRPDENLAANLTAKPNQPVVWDEGRASLTIMEFRDDLMNLGPAVRVLVRPEDGEAYAVWAVSERPDFLPDPQEPVVVDLVDQEVQYYSGFQVNRDPGVPFIWIGCGVMLLGFILAYLFSHQKTYVAVVDDEAGGRRVIAAGSAHRNRASYQIKFDRLTDRISRDNE